MPPRDFSTSEVEALPPSHSFRKSPRARETRRQETLIDLDRDLAHRFHSRSRSGKLARNPRARLLTLVDLDSGADPSRSRDCRSIVIATSRVNTAVVGVGLGRRINQAD